MNKLITFLVVVILTTVFVESAFACLCAGAPLGTSLEKQIADDYAGTPAVFVGVVVSVRHNVNRIRENGQELIGLGTIYVTFKVTRAMKGGMKVNELVTVRTVDQEGPACGIEEWETVKAGTSWLIYAGQLKGPAPQGAFLKEEYPGPGETIYITNHCTRTAPTSSATADIKYFDSLKR